MSEANRERARRWRLVLGAPADCDQLAGADAQMDAALAAVYDARGDGEDRKGGLGGSAPKVARWLGDIRQFFPQGAVRVMQQDAIDRLGLRRLLLEPEMLEAVEPSVELAALLLTLGRSLPATAKESARTVVRKTADDLARRLAEPLRQAVGGALSRATRTRRPRFAEIDWPRTIRANLRHYQPEYQTVVPEVRHGFGRRRSSLRDVILCVDQSGSMGQSVVYSGVFSATLAALPALRTRVVAFDTNVVDLSDKLSDPVDLLFGFQLGGGTDIAAALSYCQALIQRPEDTILVLISDLYEGGATERLMKRAASILAGGTRLVTLLALSDEGKPAYDRRHAAQLTALGSPAFACTPELFPELMAAAIGKQDLAQWAAARGIETTRGEDDEVL